MSIEPISNNNVISSIRSASDKVGVDFDYLLRQAEVESSLNPNAKAETSSASGLYQFIDSTWINMADKYGEKYGVSGNKQDVLSARENPEIASLMAAEFANENAKSLEENWGGEVGSTELYLAHFLGARGASDFLNAKDLNKNTLANSVSPSAAISNKSIFYDSKTGDAKTLDEVYGYFAAKFDGVDTKTKIVPQAKEPKSYEIASIPRQSPLSPLSIMMLAKLEAPAT